MREPQGRLHFLEPDLPKDFAVIPLKNLQRRNLSDALLEFLRLTSSAPAATPKFPLGQTFLLLEHQTRGHLSTSRHRGSFLLSVVTILPADSITIDSTSCGHLIQQRTFLSHSALEAGGQPARDVQSKSWISVSISLRIC